MRYAPSQIDMVPEHVAIVRALLAKHVPQHEVWAFGSRVAGRAKPYSDLDLVIIGEPPLSLAVHASLADDFSESDLPYKVDVIDWATTDTAFRQIIEQQYIVLQRRSN